MSRIMSFAVALAERVRARRQSDVQGELRRMMPDVAVQVEGDGILVEGPAVIRRCRLDPAFRALLGERS